MTSFIKAVSFKSAGIDLAADLHLPDEVDLGQRCPAVVLMTPGSSVKGQIGGNYARRLAQHGFIALVFDPSYQGESGGEPRDLENPAARIEDARSAADYLMTLPYVDEERLGLLGICAGGGYGVTAAMIERRFKALGVVVPVNIGRAFRQSDPSPGALDKMLHAIGQQRTREARGGDPRRENWLPDTLEDAKAAGIADPDVLNAVDFYRTPRGFDAHSTNRRLARSDALLIGYDAFHLASELLVQPLQVIVGGKLGLTFSFQDGKTLFELASDARDFFVVEDAGHYDMYDRAEYVDPAVDKLAEFYRVVLNGA